MWRRCRLLPALLWLCVCLGGGGGASPPTAGRGPTLLEEPPAAVAAGGGGVRLQCRAAGHPPPHITWLDEVGAQLQDQTPYRRIYVNGTLEVFLWARAGDPDAAGAAAPRTRTFRCRAANVYGAVLSRDVTVHAVSASSWSVSLLGEARGGAGAGAGAGAALLACRAPAVHDDARWFRNGVPIPQHDGEVVWWRGWALALGARGDLACGDTAPRARPPHTNTNAEWPPEPTSEGTGLMVASNEGEVRAPPGERVCLFCLCDRFCTYHWEHERSGASLVRGASVLAGGAALCVAAAPAAAGRWTCRAADAAAPPHSAARHYVLLLQPHLVVSLTPTLLVLEPGGWGRLTCAVSDPAASVAWLHDGAPGGAGGGDSDAAADGRHTLELTRASRAHRGMYQCVARRGINSVQASAEVKLTGYPPELRYTFIEQALRVGAGEGEGEVALRCAAAGRPAPALAFLLDDRPLQHYLPPHKYSVEVESSSGVASEEGETTVTSVLRLHGAGASEGGRYSCVATNKYGEATHSARLNIYGPPSVRALGAVRAVAGWNATIRCPYSGYPISEIRWWCGGRRVPDVVESGAGAGARLAARGAELLLRPARAQDVGPCACELLAPTGETTRRDFHLQVNNPPKISPFMFSSDLTEGSAVQVLCGVSSGDKPVFFSWLKDGAPIPQSLQVQEKSLDDFSLLIFSHLTAEHNGEYTCKVTNHIATVNYTAPLYVKVPPWWSVEPRDVWARGGAPLQLQCAARGHPPPSLAWHKHTGGSESESAWAALTPGSGWLTPAPGEAHAAVAAAAMHRGRYRCRAQNDVGQHIDKIINVTVYEPASVESGWGERNVSVARGAAASLRCDARGDAPLALYWTRRGLRIENSHRLVMVETAVEGGARSELRVRGAERGDAGEYTCHAENEHGRSQLLLYLHVLEPPSAPSAVRLSGLWGRGVRVAWRCGGAGARYSALLAAAADAADAADAGPTTNHTAAVTRNLTLDNHFNHEHLNRNNEESSATCSARIEDLSPATKYSVRIVAGNHVGQSDPSEPLHFTTLEEVPSQPPQSFAGKIISETEMSITWSPPPSSSCNGELHSYVVSWRLASGGGGGGYDGDAGGGAGAEGWLPVPAEARQLTLRALRPFSAYLLTISAVNVAGIGPPAAISLPTIPDGVPSESPEDVTCSPMGSSLHVRWSFREKETVTGFDVIYAEVVKSGAWRGVVAAGVVRARGGSAALRGLRAAAAYSVRVAGRGARGAGPPSPDIHCTTAPQAPSPPRSIKAVAIAKEAILVTWLPPEVHSEPITHYTLFAREIGKAGSEWSERVEAMSGSAAGEAAAGVWGEAAGGEARREVRGRRRGAHELWLTAHAAAGDSPPSAPTVVTVTDNPISRIASSSAVIVGGEGGAARLPCSAAGAAQRVWTPLPTRHRIDDGDLLITQLDVTMSGNYTCAARWARGGTDAVTHELRVATRPHAPAARLLRAEDHALILTWESVNDGGLPVVGYTVWWSRDGAAWRSRAVPAAAAAAAAAAVRVERLQCAARYRLRLTAHNALGASADQHLTLDTCSDKAVAAPGHKSCWANSSCVVVSPLAWRARCGVSAWGARLRRARGSVAGAGVGAGAGAGAWQDMPAHGQLAQTCGLPAGTWFEIRMEVWIGDSVSAVLYKVATRTDFGEKLGNPILVRVEEASSTLEAGPGEPSEVDGGGSGRAAAAAWVMAAVAAAAAAAAGLLLVTLRRRRQCAASPPPSLSMQIQQDQPKKNISSPINDDYLSDISPYATFSACGVGVGVMDPVGGVRVVGGRRCGPPEPQPLTAPPPPRPNLYLHSETREYVPQESSSSSGGSPCAACAAERRLPAAAAAAAARYFHAETLPAMESSAEDTSYSAGSGRVSTSVAAAASGGARRARGAAGGGGAASHHKQARRQHTPIRS